MGGGGGGGSSTTVVKRLPDYATPYVQAYLARGAELSREAYSPYTGITYASQNQNELDGITALAIRGKEGDVVIHKGISYINNVLDGAYLTGTNVFTNMLGNLKAKVSSSFDTVRGNIGSSVYYNSGDNLALYLSSGMKDKIFGRLDAKIYADNYDNERKIQINAIGKGIDWGNQEVIDAETLRTAGVYAREWLQGLFEDNYKKWMEREVAAIRRLEILGNTVRALVGTQVATTSPIYRPSPAQAAISGVMGGAMVGYMIGSVPGAIIGGILGGVAGLFGR